MPTSPPPWFSGSPAPTWCWNSASCAFPAQELQAARERLRDKAGWADAAGYAVSDVTLLRRELLRLFIVEGSLAATLDSGGLTFGGTVAFRFADLITPGSPGRGLAPVTCG